MGVYKITDNQVREAVALIGKGCPPTVVAAWLHVSESCLFRRIRKVRESDARKAEEAIV